MPYAADYVPKYRRHRASGQAIVTLAGQDIYLGPHGTEVSHAEYDRRVGEWLAAGRQSPRAGSFAQDLTIVQMLDRYERFADQHYRKHGQRTNEYKNVGYAARPLREIYGHTQARDFGPLALKALQQHLIGAQLCRNVINSRIGRIKRIFKWAVSEELVPADVLHGLQAVSGLQFGRSKARETKRVKPVPDADFFATLPHLPPVVADMVQIEPLTGCRPTELCQMRPCDIDRSGPIWVYRPESHKTEHHDKERVIFIGPRAQKILRPYLLRPADAYCFTPRDSERKRKARLREARKSPVQPSQVDRRKPDPQFQPGGQYTKDSYGRAVRRACDAAGVPRWTPNRLRHTAGTKFRKRFGLEVAQNVLGHAKADITQIYAERDQAAAAKAVKEFG